MYFIYIERMSLHLYKLTSVYNLNNLKIRNVTNSYPNHILNHAHVFRFSTNIICIRSYTHQQLTGMECTQICKHTSVYNTAWNKHTSKVDKSLSLAARRSPRNILLYRCWSRAGSIQPLWKHIQQNVSWEDISTHGYLEIDVFVVVMFFCAKDPVCRKKRPPLWAHDHWHTTHTNISRALVRSLSGPIFACHTKKHTGFQALVPPATGLPSYLV